MTTYAYINAAGERRELRGSMMNPPPDAIVFSEDGAWCELQKSPVRHTLMEVFRRDYSSVTVHVRWQHPSWGTASAPQGCKGEGRVPGVRVK